MAALIVRFVRNESGATAIEYGLVAGLIAVALITAFTIFGSSLQGIFGRVRDKAGNAMNNAGI